MARNRRIVVCDCSMNLTRETYGALMDRALYEACADEGILMIRENAPSAICEACAGASGLRIVYAADLAAAMDAARAIFPEADLFCLTDLRGLREAGDRAFLDRFRVAIACRDEEKTRMALLDRGVWRMHYDSMTVLGGFPLQE